MTKSNKIDTKALVVGAIAVDQQLCAAGKPGHVTAWDARQLYHDSKRASPGSDNGRAGKPNRVTLAVDGLPGFPGDGADLLLSMRPDKKPKHVVLLVAISVEVAKEVARQATSRIITPDQAIASKT